jgi:hypothetical protein
VRERPKLFLRCRDEDDEEVPEAMTAERRERGEK